MTETTLQDKVNEFLDYVVYLQIMGSFVPNSDFRQIKQIVTSTYDFIKNSSEEEVETKLPELRNVVIKMTSLFMDKFPLKRDLRKITTEFNSFCKSSNDVYSYGLMLKWI